MYFIIYKTIHTKCHTIAILSTHSPAKGYLIKIMLTITYMYKDLIKKFNLQTYQCGTIPCVLSSDLIK